jgi:DnaK suppressor protein
MDEQRARARLEEERTEVAALLEDTEQAGRQDRESEAETGDIADSAQPLAAEAQDDAIAESLRDRLATIDRALKRLDEGSYGRSVRSGVPIPDERLDADPAAELTVEEAKARP